MVAWIMNTLKGFVPVLPEGHKYNSQALYLNTNNLNEMSKHTNPMDWLNYSPTTDDTLKDSELGIDLNSVTTKDN